MESFILPFVFLQLLLQPQVLVGLLFVILYLRMQLVIMFLRRLQSVLEFVDLLVELALRCLFEGLVVGGLGALGRFEGRKYP